MKSKLTLLTLFFFCVMNASFAQKYVFYLHGRIVEEQGANAVHPDYGAYEYEAILESFRSNKFTVISEVRQKGANTKDYAAKIMAQVDSLLKKGIAPDSITIVGAAQGGRIAMYVSTFLKNEKVNFVFLAGCFPDIAENMPDIRFSGNILSIYDQTDAGGASCITIKSKSSSSVSHYKEIVINTGLHHGFLFRPIPEWMEPTIKWANGNYQ